jgi:hypothetical protein
MHLYVSGVYTCLLYNAATVVPSSQFVLRCTAMEGERGLSWFEMESGDGVGDLLLALMCPANWL